MERDGNFGICILVVLELCECFMWSCWFISDLLRSFDEGFVIEVGNVWRFWLDLFLVSRLDCLELMFLLDLFKILGWVGVYLCMGKFFL